MANPVHFSVLDAMIACGMDNAVPFNGDTAAQRITDDVFSDDFDVCMDKTHEDLDSDFKTYSELTIAQGQIRLLPGTKRNIKAFIQWVRDQRRLGLNPRDTAFPVLEAPNLLRRYKTHERFIKRSSTLAEAAKPDKFTNDTKWEDWSPTFINYLRTIPGRDGVPLSYICRKKDEADPEHHMDFLDDYVNMAPLEGEAFTIDAAQVHTFIMNFISGNQTAEAKIQAYLDMHNGRMDFKALKDYYEGVGVHSIQVTKAENTLKTLFYSGEKRPHMWWDEFERQLTASFVSIDKMESREVYSTPMKLRILLDKVNADFLTNIKAGISIELTKRPMTMTYERAIEAFRNEVTRKFPPGTTTITRTRRNINQLDQHDHHNKPMRKQTRHPKRTRSDSSFITLVDGKVIEYHPSFNFPPQVFAKIKPADKEQLKRERASYKKSKHQQRQIQELQQQLRDMKSTTKDHEHSNDKVPSNVSDHATQVSQLTQRTASTMMGGRNEQARLRSNRQ